MGAFSLIVVINLLNRYVNLQMVLKADDSDDSKQNILSRRISFYQEYFNAPDWNMEYERYLERASLRQQLRMQQFTHSPWFWETSDHVEPKSQQSSPNKDVNTELRSGDVSPRNYEEPLPH